MTETCPVLDVCCLLLHLDPLLCLVSPFLPQEHFCWDLSHPDFSLLSFCISSPFGVAKADEGVSGFSLQLCCAFLVTPPIFYLFLSLFIPCLLVCNLVKHHRKHEAFELQSRLKGRVVFLGVRFLSFIWSNFSCMPLEVQRVSLAFYKTKFMHSGYRDFNSWEALTAKAQSFNDKHRFLNPK